MKKEPDIIIAGYLNKSDWGGRIQPREQDFVIHPNGVCMSIPSSYNLHPFKILEYEQEIAEDDHEQPYPQYGGYS
jgi:hypothetical protein